MEDDQVLQPVSVDYVKAAESLWFILGFTSHSALALSDVHLSHAVTVLYHLSSG